MQRSRLFHAVVLAGASWGATVAGCSSAETTPSGGVADEGTGPKPGPAGSSASKDDGGSAARVEAEGYPEAGVKDGGFGTNSGPGHVMDGGVHDGGDGGWPPTK